MTILSNIYIEIDLDFTEQDKVYGKQYLEELVQKQSQILYRQQNVEVRIHLEDGSLKIYISIAAFLYIAIGQYGSFRSGLDYLKKDTQAIYQTITKDLKKNGLSKDHIKKKKINSGVIDKLKRLIIRLEKLEGSNTEDHKTQREIVNIRRYTEKILYDVGGQKDRDFIVAELHKIDSKALVYEDRKPQPLQRPNPTNIFIRNEEENQEYLWELSNSSMWLSHDSDEPDEVKHIELKN